MISLVSRSKQRPSIIISRKYKTFYVYHIIIIIIILTDVGSCETNTQLGRRTNFVPHNTPRDDNDDGGARAVARAGKTT